MGLKHCGGITTEDIARRIGDILELPITKYFRWSKATRITSSILNIMAESLRNDEDVTIPYFGTFRVVNSPATRRGYHYYFGPEKTLVSGVTEVPVRRKVRFAASPALITFIEEQEPTSV